jgi:hypothetical protein
VIYCTGARTNTTGICSSGERKRKTELASSGCKRKKRKEEELQNDAEERTEEIPRIGEKPCHEVKHKERRMEDEERSPGGVGLP